MLVMGLGLVQPGIWSHSFDLQKMYAQCAHEDPDIDPLDFVVEHLLNLEDILAFVEGEEESEPGELPHQPYQAIQSAAGFFVALPKTASVFPPTVIEVSDVITYPPARGGFYYCDYNADVFRPPIV